MKLLHFSDLHIGMENYAKLDPISGLSTRLLDFFNTFDFIVDTATKEEVDAVVFAGDAYKTRDPNPTQQRGFGERIKKLAKANIPTVLVVGNHDTPNAEGKANTLDIYSALEIDNVWVSRIPQFLEIPTKSGILQVVTLPWLHKNDYKEVGEKLNLLYEKIDKNLPAIFLSHCEVVGASYGSEKGLAIANDVTIPLSLIQDRRLDYCALGHIHKHQVLSKAGDSPLIVYSGSPQRIDFGEEKEDKGVCLVEINKQLKMNSEQLTKKGDSELLIQNCSFKFLPTSARKFLTITINLKPDDKEPTKAVLEEIKKHDVTDTIVRVVINIPAECEDALEMDKIKKSLQNAQYIAGISRNVERRIRDKEAVDVETLTPLQALQKYWESKKYSEEKQKQMEKYATELLDNSKTDFY
jgi:DNA repair protein SbcD/Mre11